MSCSVAYPCHCLIAWLWFTNMPNWTLLMSSSDINWLLVKNNQMNKHFGQEQVIRTVVPWAMLAFNHLLRNMSRASASEVAWTCTGGPTHSYGVLSTCVRGAQGEGVDITYQCHCRVNLQCVLIIPLRPGVAWEGWEDYDGLETPSQFNRRLEPNVGDNRDWFWCDKILMWIQSNIWCQRGQSFILKLFWCLHFS